MTIDRSDCEPQRFKRFQERNYSKHTTALRVLPAGARGRRGHRPCGRRGRRERGRRRRGAERRGAVSAAPERGPRAVCVVSCRARGMWAFDESGRS